MHILHIEALLRRFGHLLLQYVGELAGTRVPIVVHVAKATLVLEELCTWVSFGGMEITQIIITN